MVLLHKYKPVQTEVTHLHREQTSVKTTLCWETQVKERILQFENCYLVGCKEQGCVLMRIQPIQTDLEHTLQ